MSSRSISFKKSEYHKWFIRSEKRNCVNGFPYKIESESNWLRISCCDGYSCIQECNDQEWEKAYILAHELLTSAHIQSNTNNTC